MYIGKAWETVLQDIGNSHSFEQVYINNAHTCPLTLEKVISDSHGKAWSQLSGKDLGNAVEGHMPVQVAVSDGSHTVQYMWAEKNLPAVV